MNCKLCKYYEKKCLLNKCIYKDNEIDRKKHKCYKCVWGSWTGRKYYCILPRCIK